MEIVNNLLTILFHLDGFLINLSQKYSIFGYFVLFTIIFLETGIVILPFLPGDSLLFLSGSIATAHNTFNIWWLFLILTIASILGNQLNYIVGKIVGQHAFSENNKFFKKKYLIEACNFYEKHGGKTVILARFIPIIRTFVPFVAGVCKMHPQSFVIFNVVGAICWIGILLSVGFFLGGIHIIKQNYNLVIYSIILLSILPPAIGLINKKLNKQPKV